MVLVSVDAAQFYRLPVDAEHPVDQLRPAKPDFLGDVYAADGQDQGVQVRGLCRPFMGIVDPVLSDLRRRCVYGF